jgi:small-conductance mechanosensitive channel
MGNSDGGRPLFPGIRFGHRQPDPGVCLTYTRSFRVGNMVKVRDAIGVVLERRLYRTRIKTQKNHIITIPNRTILSGHVTNLSHEVREGEGLIFNTNVTIDYDAPWETAHTLLIKAASGRCP